MLQDDHPERQTQKKTKLENNFKKKPKWRRQFGFVLSYQRLVISQLFRKSSPINGMGLQN